MYEAEQCETRGSFVGRDLIAKQRAAEQTAAKQMKAARPLDRGSISQGRDRLLSVIDKLRSTRQRVSRVADLVVGVYPTAGNTKGTDDPAPNGIAQALHVDVDTIDEELGYLIDAVNALEGSVE
jgi:hypothetical protein